MSLHELLLRNRTFRKFRQTPLRDEDLMAIMEDVRLAHCANNLQLLRYAIVTGPGKRKEIEPIIHFAAKLPPEIGEPKEGEKPMAYIIIEKPSAPDHHSDIDVGIASEIITESAMERGIGSCIMMNFNVTKMNEILSLPSDMTCSIVIALGYPSHTSEVTDLEGEDTVYHVNTEDYSYTVPKRSVDDLIKVFHI